MQLHTFKNRSILKWIVGVSLVPPTFFFLLNLLDPEASAEEKNISSYLIGFLVSFAITASLFYYNTWVLDATFVRWPKPAQQRKRLAVALTATILGSNMLALLISLLFNMWSGSPVELFSNVVAVTVITLVVSLWFLGYHFIELWRHSVLEKEQMEKEQISNQLAGLRHQLSPHFLFNSFNALQSLIEEDPQKAQQFVQQLSGMYRYTLVNAEEPLVPLSDELHFIEKYLYLQQVRFGKNLKSTIDAEPGCMNMLLPSLSLQILVENAIKHNIVSASRPLHISILESGNQIQVINELQPRADTGTNTGIGLENLFKRYQLLNAGEPVIRRDDGKFTAILPLLTTHE